MIDGDEIEVFWEMAELEALIRRLVPRGESTKVDLKASLELSNEQSKAELLKDISAMANTLDHANRNYGFLVLGATGNALSYTQFSQNEDHLQATVDDLVKHYIEPFVPSRLYMFGQGQQQWGVILIPPTRNAPHVFVKDIHKRSRGDIYVRRGTVTEKAMPGDYARFFGQRLEEHAYQLRVEMRELQQRVKALETVPRPRGRRTTAAPAPDASTRPLAVGSPAPDLLQEIEQKLGSSRDPISEGLSRAAREIDSYMRSSQLPWALQATNKEQGEQLLQGVEDKSRPYWQALARVIHLDDAGKYDDAVIASLAVLARQYAPPPGTPFNSGGEGLRHYALVFALHVAFVVGAARSRYKLLRRIAQIPLEGSYEHDEPGNLADVLFSLRRADAVFQSQHPQYPQSRWCDGVSVRIKGLIETIADSDDALWRREAAFFVGEFLVSLLPMEIGANEESRNHPSAGSFLYYDGARPAITRFLKKNLTALESMYVRPLREILAGFDESARKLVSPSCFADGFATGALSAAYPGDTAVTKS